MSLSGSTLRVFVSLILTAVFSGCSFMMPEDIQTMEKRTHAAAEALLKAHPEASQHYTVGDRPMHYVEITDDKTKPLILFIHGSPGDWRGWTDYLADPALVAQAHMIAVDRPGFGDSGGGQVERSLEEQSRAIAPLLAHASKGQRVIVVGHSYGGPLAARLAMDFGAQISDIIILAGSIDPDQEKTLWYQYPADWVPFTWVIPDKLIVTNREIRALKPELQAMLPLWPKITQRVTVIQGQKDDLVPPANADFAEHMLINATLAVIRLPDANHFLPWLQTDLVKKTITEHLHDDTKAKNKARK